MLKSLKVLKISILKMYSNKRNKMLIIYVRPKILKLTRDIIPKRPLKSKACIGSNFRVPKSLTYKSKNKKCSVILKGVKCWEEQSFINIHKVSLSSAKFKICTFNKMFKVSIGRKHNKNINKRS